MTVDVYTGVFVSGIVLGSLLTYRIGNALVIKSFGKINGNGNGHSSSNGGNGKSKSFNVNAAIMEHDVQEIKQIAVGIKDRQMVSNREIQMCFSSVSEKQEKTNKLLSNILTELRNGNGKKKR